MRVGDPADMLSWPQYCTASSTPVLTSTMRSWSWPLRAVEIRRRALRKGTIENLLVPVTCGTSYRNKGVQKLLDAIVDFMPSPLDIPAIKGVNPDTDEEDERPADDNAPFSALAFMIMTDPMWAACPSSVYSQAHRFSRAQQHQRTRRSASAHPARCTCHHREDIEEESSPAISYRRCGPKNTTTAITSDDNHPIILSPRSSPP